MRIFVAGAAGAIGRQLTPMLVEAGHEVTGTTRSEERAAWLAGIDAKPVVLDVYDAEAVRRAVVESRARWSCGLVIGDSRRSWDLRFRWWLVSVLRCRGVARS